MEKVMIGLIVVFSVVLGVVSVGGSDTYREGEKVKKLIKECESKLPRNETCKIISVRGSDDNNSN